MRSTGSNPHPALSPRGLFLKTLDFPLLLRQNYFLPQKSALRDLPNKPIFSATFGVIKDYAPSFTPYEVIYVIGGDE
jgi:hypothetical protein